MASDKQNSTDFTNYGESIGRLSFTTLGNMELEALDMLDESIGCFETKETGKYDSDSTLERKVDHERFEQNDIFQRPEKQPLGSMKDSIPPKLNAGYILFDGAEIKYISKDKCTADISSVTKPDQDFDESLHSRASSLTHVSELATHLNMSYDELIGRTVQRVSLTPYNRLPPYAHFSVTQKCYLLATGLAPVLAVNAFYMSVAFFLPLLGRQVLSRIGICHNVPFLAAMLLIFCGKKHWVPFLPTVPICLVFMAACVTVIPALTAAGFTVPVFVIYGVVTLNGLCAGLSQSLTSRIAVLFPGGKSSSLIGYGASLGTLLPAVVQMMIILLVGLKLKDSQLVEQNTLFLYVLFGMVFVGILTGLISLIQLSRTGIYELFAGRDCAAHSPKNITLGSVSETAKRRYLNIKWCLFAEFALSLVSYYVFSLAPLVHEVSIESPHSNTAPFWNIYLATMFVGVFKCGGFLGGILANLCCYGRKPQKKATQFLYLTASICRLGFVVAAALFIREPFFVYHNLFMMALYFLLALTNGFVSIAIASSCQSMVRGQRKDTCPIISQLIWLSGQVGVTIGIALSFIHMAV